MQTIALANRVFPDIWRMMDSVSELLDRSVGAKEYIIRSAGAFHPLIDLNQLNFEQLTLNFAANKRTAALAIEKNLAKRLVGQGVKEPDQAGAGRAVPATYRGLQALRKWVGSRGSARGSWNPPEVMGGPP